jgi:hypothetical protein
MSIAGNIVDAIFDSVDASIWIFRFLETSTFRPSFAVADGHVTNWTAECSTPGAPFGEIARFVGCLLYPNVTRSLLNGTLPVISGDTDNINLTSVGFTSPDLGLSLRSIYSTCLPTYCASVSECAATDFCDVGNLLSSSFELSAQGVGQCYNSICSRDVTPPNPDIARIGVCI